MAERRASRGGVVDPEVDVAVVGGGAAGLVAGIFAARDGKKVLLLESSRECGLKILISGGGRCNVLPSTFEPNDFFTEGSQNTLRKILRAWPLTEVKRFFEVELRCPLLIEAGTGKMFPKSQKAREVRDRLVEELERAGGQIFTGFRVEAIDRDSRRFILRGGENPDPVVAETVILATGGKSVPKTGSDGHGYLLARRFGHTTTRLYPALVPLTTDDPAPASLAGISLPVTWKAVREGKAVDRRTRELLFTHRGFSGPGILDASHWWTRDRAEISVSWGGRSREEWQSRLLSQPSRDCLGALAEVLPRRLAAYLCELVIGKGSIRLGNLRREARRELLRNLWEYRLPIEGSSGFRVAEVTGGGVPLSEVETRSLESRHCPGLYLCGEILDVIGRIGGYNFLWAWVTGRIAGESSAQRLSEA